MENKDAYCGSIRKPLSATAIPGYYMFDQEAPPLIIVGRRLYTALAFVKEAESRPPMVAAIPVLGRIGKADVREFFPLDEVRFTIMENG